MPALHCSMTSFGLPAMNIGAAITGSLRRCRMGGSDIRRAVLFFAARSRSSFGGAKRGPSFFASSSARLTNFFAPTWFTYCSAPPVQAGKPMPKIEPMLPSCTCSSTPSSRQRAVSIAWR